MNTPWACAVAIAASLLSLNVTHAASTETVLHVFTGTDGAYPAGGVTFDAAGNIYTTTTGAGAYNGGTVVKLTPPAVGKTAWTETVLYSLPWNSDPQASVVLDAAGNLYGTTRNGGGGGFTGSVFKLTPPAAGKTAWTETVLDTFSNNNDGSQPVASLIFDKVGNLYGTTSYSGPSGGVWGTVFKLTPPVAGKTAWTETVLHGFTETGGDGGAVWAGVSFDAAGNLYGTTAWGGSGSNAWGTVFRLTPPVAGKTAWTETVLYTFTGGTDGANPSAGVVVDGAGNVYGTTSGGGKSGLGTVFKLSPPAAGKTTWTKTVLTSFNLINTTAGDYPAANLILDAAGNLYGTTTRGGKFGYGEVFKLSPPAPGTSAWKLTLLHSFTSANGDGSQPVAGLIFGPGGALYGTTEGGGSSGCNAGCGTVFKLTP